MTQSDSNINAPPSPAASRPAQETITPDYANRRTPRPRTFLGQMCKALLVGLLLGVVTGLIAYLSIPIRFTCTGTIDVRPVLSPLPIGDNSDPKTMSWYASFIAMQMQMIASERCRDLAFASPRRMGSGRGVVRSSSPAAAEDFKRHLSVTRDGELLRVTFTDRDKETAQDSVAAVIQAYDLLKDDMDPDNPRMRQNLLVKTRQDYQSKLSDLQSQMQAIVERAGASTPDALRVKYNNRLNEIYQAEKELALSQTALEDWKTSHAGAPAAPATASADVVPPLAQLEAREQLERTRLAAMNTEVKQLAAYMRQLDDLQRQCDQIVVWRMQTELKLEELRLTQSGPGRIVLLSLGERPIEKDRFWPIAIASGTAFVGGILLFLLIGAFTARSYRHRLPLTTPRHDPQALDTSHPPA